MRVDVARPVVAVEQGRDAAETAGHAQGIQHGQGVFGQGDGHAHAAPGGHIEDDRDLRLEGLTVIRVQHFRIEGGAVGRIHVGGPQFGSVAALVRPQPEQRIARGPARLALGAAHLAQQAAAGMDARRLLAPRPHGPAQGLMRHDHRWMLRHLIECQEVLAPGRYGVSPSYARRQGGRAAFRQLYAPAPQRPLRKVRSPHARQSLRQQRRQTLVQFAEP